MQKFERETFLDQNGLYDRTICKNEDNWSMEDQVYDWMIFNRVRIPLRQGFSIARKILLQYNLFFSIFSIMNHTPMSRFRINYHNFISCDSMSSIYCEVNRILNLSLLRTLFQFTKNS